LLNKSASVDIVGVIGIALKDTAFEAFLAVMELPA
jgi:hypothetical protein